MAHDVNGPSKRFGGRDRGLTGQRNVLRSVVTTMESLRFGKSGECDSLHMIRRTTCHESRIREREAGHFGVGPRENPTP